MNLLHIDASITGAASVSRQLSRAVVDAFVRIDPSIRVTHRDLDAEPIPHLDSRGVAALRPDLVHDDQSGEGQRVAQLLEEFLGADIVVIGAPMYNFSIPSQLKAWFDRILVSGKTFRYAANGVEGLAGGKKVIVASARGGVYGEGAPAAPFDFHEPYLRALFGFIGIGEVKFVRAEGLAISPASRLAAIDAAFASLPDVVGHHPRAAAA